MDTKICQVCGKEKPLEEFSRNRWGVTKTCRDCVVELRRDSRFARRDSVGGGKKPPFHDPDFDGKDPGEVVRMMGRAKRWLESRGFIIQLSGEFHETKIRKLKFE